MQHEQSSLGKTASYQKYAEKILNLRTEFETRFADFKSLEDKFSLFLQFSQYI